MMNSQMGGQIQGAPQNQQQMQQPQALYDQVTEQNFGNPYDCPEGAYGGSMMSSIGYSKVLCLKMIISPSLSINDA